MIVAGLVNQSSISFAQQPAADAGSFNGFDGEFRGEVQPPEEPLSLWYRRQATKWVEALAVGNGRLGAMVFDGIDRERLQLNEDTLWAGDPYDPNNPEALGALPEARRLIFEGKYTEAHKLVGDKMLAKPVRQMPYQPVGDLLLTFPRSQTVANYRRDLNLDTAITRTTYEKEGVRFTREVFSSPVDQVIVVRISAYKPGQITFRAGMQTPQAGSVSVEGQDTLVLSGTGGDAFGIPGVIKFQARVRVMSQNGKTVPGKDSIEVNRADSATLLIAAATSYESYKDVGGNPEALTKRYLAKAEGKSIEIMRREHITEHQRLFRRVKLDLGMTSAMQFPTDERIRNFATSEDPQLAVLYYQFGRYLLISSSRD
jgi:alpha-L-fucosidase 2